MKGSHKDSGKFMWDQMRIPSIGSVASQNRVLPKLMFWISLFVTATYAIYTLKLLNTSQSCDYDFTNMAIHSNVNISKVVLNTYHNSNEERNASLPAKTEEEKTGLQHIVFGIAASAKLWDKRKNYIKLWWKEDTMRGIVWLDNRVKTASDDSLPELRISGDTSKFRYSNRQGHRSAIRISRIISETLRLGMTNVRWFVMGDDDTVFVTENLVRVLNKYDHNQYYYIGSVSESHLQNIYFSYNMAYGGGGFAISYPLAVALEKMQDRCIQRYPGLYGSDDRMQACMAELGVPLTKEPGFHQYDVYGNLFGLLAAHPVAPFVTLHHLDVVEPIFPNVTRVQALQRLLEPMKLDSAGLMQQSICYDVPRGWTISVSWGYAIQIFRGILSPREVEMPSRTFLNWYRRADYTAYAFNTRPVMRNACQKPFVFHLSKARMDSSGNTTVTEYVKNNVAHPFCKWKMADPAQMVKVEVHKKPDSQLWDRVNAYSLKLLSCLLLLLCLNLKPCTT
ncbi:OLC1v1029823C2 [Oldenlandia corymbosa var. corymbosa]|uniref:OLC1v1029823C2 n=1 Tax=Oldenlandia corymbosa var. corymbosa TaxID=529605 RepID=A0AAV1CHP8_OLDCO|nr:OLC1v1029823C2 [Oldenlandia corymbosa var. corymbosa]